MRLKVILGLLLAGVIVIFAVLNATSVPVSLIFETINLPLSILMLVLLAIGMLAGMLLHSLTAKKKTNKNDLAEEKSKTSTKKKKR